MKKYVSHKVVEAAPIRAVHAHPGRAVYVSVEGDGPPIQVPTELADRLAGAVPGSPNKSFLNFYLVRYSDGYLSFSPAKAFEEGYTELVEGEADFSSSEEAAAIREDVKALWAGLNDVRTATLAPPPADAVDPSLAFLNEVRAAFSQLAAPRQWEYVSARGASPALLGDAGRDGWEAYAVSVAAGGELVHHFKRLLRA